MAKCVWCGRRKKLFETFNKYGFCPECKTQVRQDIENKISEVEKFLKTYKNGNVQNDDERLRKSVCAHMATLDDLEKLRRSVPMFKSSTDHLRTGLVAIERAIESRRQTNIEQSATASLNTNNVDCPVEELNEVSAAPLISVNKMFPRVKQVGDLRIDNSADYQMFDNLLKSIEHEPITFVWDVENRRQKITMPEVKFTNVVKRSKREILCNYTVVDVETTGLSSKRDAIIEISAIKFRAFSPVAAFSTLVNPQKNISEEIVRITGITDDMVADQPFFFQVVPRLLEFIEKDTLVGHNLVFDLKFLAASGVDVFSMKRRFYDTLSLAKKALPQYKLIYNEDGSYERDYSVASVENYKLSTLCDYYKIYRSNAHRSESDCLATGLLFKELVDEILD